MNSCWLLILLASSTQQCIFSPFPAENSVFCRKLAKTAFLNFKFSGMPVADGWLAMACKFFGGLTNVSRLATA